MHRLVWPVVLALAACTLGDDPLVPEDGDDGATDVEALAASGFRVTRDVPYTPTQVLDLYTPLGASPANPRALVIWIHGGGFARNSKLDPHIRALARHTAQLGYVTASIDYTLANPDLDDAHPFPYPWPAVTAARTDALSAIRYLRAHASELGIDPTRIALGGASAGAITALETVYGSSQRDPAIRAVIDLWGAMEQQQLLQSGDAPLLILHGTADHLWMPYAQALRLRDSARAHGVPVTFIPLAGKNHGPWDGLPSYLDDITTFLHAHL